MERKSLVMMRQHSLPSPPPPPVVVGKRIHPDQRRRAAAELQRQHRANSMPVAAARKEKLIYQSPRCEQPDDELFPDLYREKLHLAEGRWNYLSKQAVGHEQDGTVLRMVDGDQQQQRYWTPESVRQGFPVSAAARVKELHLTTNNALPEWLDVVAMKFSNLQHLYLESQTTMNNDAANERGDEQIEVDKFAVAVEPQTSPSSLSETEDRVRRLYILYRLPDLLSVNGLPVCAEERSLARPNDPNGQRVQREDWVENTAVSLLDKEDEEQVDDGTILHSDLGDSVEVGLSDKYVPLASEAASHRSQSCRTDASSEEKKGNSPQRRTRVTVCPASDEKMVPSPVASSSSSSGVVEDGDRFEYVSVESSAAPVGCEWTAACGSLSLPYFRGGEGARRQGRISESKSRFKLAFRRSRNPETEPEEAPSAGTHQQHTLRSEYLAPTSLQTQSEQATVTPPRRVYLLPIETAVGTPDVSGADRLLVPQRNESPVSGTSSVSMSNSSAQSAPSANRILPPSQSLSSPFPMQFRMRAAGAPTLKRELSVSTKFPEEDGVSSRLSPPSPPPTPRAASPSNMETIEAPVGLTRTQSSPSKLCRSKSNPGLSVSTARSNLPPPCPRSERRNVPLTPTSRNRKARSRSSKRGLAKWREQLHARSTSIIDNEEEEEEEEEDGMSSDGEENVVISKRVERLLAEVTS